MKVLNRAAAAAAALLIMLLAAAVSPIAAFSSHAEVSIPVTVAWSKDSDKPGTDTSISSVFTLSPLDGAPAPAKSEITLADASKGEIGPIAFDMPGDYYYSLDGKINGESNSVNLTVRVSVFNGESGLETAVTAYKTKEAAQAGEGKSDTVFEITYKAPKKPSSLAVKGKPVSTAAESFWLLWLLLGGAAVLLAGLFSRLSAEK